MKAMPCLAVMAFLVTVHEVARAEAAAPAGASNQPENSADSGRVTLSASFGYGFGNGSESLSDDVLGIGFGVRGGYTFSATHLYLGGTLLKYAAPSGESGTRHSLLLQAEVGFDITAGPVIIRPYLGWGPLLAVFTATDDSEGGSGIFLPVVPGLLVWSPMGRVTLGAEARFELSPDFHGRTGSLLGSVGVAF